jgi:hypothetical protein
LRWDGAAPNKKVTNAERLMDFLKALTHFQKFFREFRKNIGILKTIKRIVKGKARIREMAALVAKLDPDVARIARKRRVKV